MASSKFLPIGWTHFTGNHAEIMEAYFSLLQREGTTIGTGESVQWMRAPSHAAVRVADPHGARAREGSASQRQTPLSGLTPAPPFERCRERPTADPAEATLSAQVASVVLPALLALQSMRSPTTLRLPDPTSVAARDPFA